MTRCIFRMATQHYLKVRSMVGLFPLFAVETLEPEGSNEPSGISPRMDWFLDNISRTLSNHLDKR